MLPARGPFCDGSSSKLTRCPSFSCSKLPETELRWKNHSCPPSSRMNPNPRSRTSRLIWPPGIRVSLGTPPRCGAIKFCSARDAKLIRCRIHQLLDDVNRNRGTESFHGCVRVVPELQRQPVLPGRQLHVHFGLRAAVVDPRIRLRNYTPGRQTLGVDADVMVSHALACGGHVALRHRGELVVLDAEAQLDRTLDRRAVGGLDEKHPWGARRGFSGRGRRPWRGRRRRRGPRGRLRLAAAA